MKRSKAQSAKKMLSESLDPGKQGTRRCARRVLEPLLHVLMAAGLSENDLVAICQQIVRRSLTQRIGRPLASLTAQTHLEHVIARWNNDPKYIDGGEPSPLRLRGKPPSFSSLVRAVSAKASAVATLKLLHRRGLARLDRAGRVRLLARFYPVRARDAIDLELFTTMTIDFLRTHEFNFLKNPPHGYGLFQRVAHKRNSDARVAPEFNRYVRDQGQMFLERIDEWLSRHQPSPLRRSRTRVRLGVGMYVINESLR